MTDSPAAAGLPGLRELVPRLDAAALGLPGGRRRAPGAARVARVGKVIFMLPCICY
jgi:hypothetical protein